jgi:hypothetical protein
MRTLNTVLMDGLPKMAAAFYGEGGTGKTTLLGQFASDPRTSPMFWIDAVGNPQVLQLQGITLYGFALDHYRDVIEVVDFFNSGQSPKHPLRAKLELPGDLVFKSLTIDTASYLQQRLMDHIYELSPDTQLKKQGLVQIEATKHGSKIIGTYLSLVRTILAVPVHTFMTYQYFEKVAFQGAGDGTIGGASTQAQVQLYGSSRVIIPPWHNLLGLLEKTQGIDPRTKRPGTLTSLTWRAPDKTGKNQLSTSLPEKMLNPTAVEILDAIQQDWAALQSNSLIA